MLQGFYKVPRQALSTRPLNLLDEPAAAAEHIYLRLDNMPAFQAVGVVSEFVAADTKG